MNTPEVIHTQIWEETPEPDNPFAAAACYCYGYDVYGGRMEWLNSHSLEMVWNYYHTPD